MTYPHTLASRCQAAINDTRTTAVMLRIGRDERQEAERLIGDAPVILVDDPDAALRWLINDWMPEFFKGRRKR
jgi:hypothetical protein